jgi:hypothetical protein
MTEQQYTEIVKKGSTHQQQCLSDLTIVHAIIYVSTDNSLTAYKSTSSRPKKFTNRAKKVTHKIMKA